MPASVATRGVNAERARAPASGLFLAVTRLEAYATRGLRIRPRIATGRSMLLLRATIGKPASSPTNTVASAHRGSSRRAARAVASVMKP